MTAKPLMKFPHFLLLFLMIFAGCSYDFASDNFIDLEQPQNNTQFIELVNFTDQDTINVRTSFRYNFNGTEDQNTITSEVFLNNERINSRWEGDFGTFDIDPANYEDGNYTIRIEHTFSSGSGSIADQAGLEVIEETAEYQFVINREPSPAPAILSASIIDGSIFIEWSTDFEQDYISAFLSLQFKNDEIRIPLSEEQLALGIYNDLSTVLYQGDSNTPDFDEYSSVTYSIALESEFEILYGDSQSISYDPSSVSIELLFVDFNSYIFRWSAHPMYRNFDMFEFSNADGQFTGSSQGGEYLVQTPYVFGEEYRLNGRPVGTEFLLPTYSYRDVSLSTDTFGVFEMDSLFVKEILYSPTTNNYYALVVENRSSSAYEFSIYQYSNDMVFLQKSSLITFDNVRHEYLRMALNPEDNNLYVDARGSAYKIDGITLEILDQFNDPPLTSELIYRGNILVRLDYATGQLTVTDVSSDTILYSVNSPSSNAGYLSPTGEYIFISEDTGSFLYRIEGSGLVQVLDFTQTAFNGSIEISEDTLFYSSNNEIIIVDLTTNDTKSFSFGSTQQSVQFDSFSQNLLASQNGLHAIYDTVTEEVIIFESEDNKQATGIFNQEDRDYFMRLRNGRLIHSKGLYIELD